MSEKQILVVQKHPGQQASIEPLLENTLEAFQKFVGGHIEVVSVCQDLVIVCNEEGRLLNLPYNTNVCGFDFYGPILAVGVKCAQLSGQLCPRLSECDGRRRE